MVYIQTDNTIFFLRILQHQPLSETLVPSKVLECIRITLVLQLQCR